MWAESHTHSQPYKEPAADATVLVLVYVRCEMQSADTSVSAFRFRTPFTGQQGLDGVIMILPQVHLRKPCYDFTFL
jgi:hypothetical protein